MDKERAKFILQSFRPDGADASDTDFADALQTAAENHELAEWLAEERASDAVFAEALNSIAIPDELRMHILTVMRGEKPGNPAMEAEMDELFSDALEQITPPSDLREQILAAVQVQQIHSNSQKNQESRQDIHEENQKSAPTSDDDNIVTISRASKRHRIKALRIASLAAAITLGGFLATQINLNSSAQEKIVSHSTLTDSTHRITSQKIQEQAANFLNTKFALDIKNQEKKQISSWLVNHELPSPTFSRLPSGLRGLKVMGCKKFHLGNGRSAALLCFVESDGNMVHLLIINNDFIKDAHLPSMQELRHDDCYQCSKTGWNILRWRDRDNTYIMFGKSDEQGESDLLEYF